MAESENPEAIDLESDTSVRPIPGTLKAGIWTVLVTVVCVAGAFVAGFPTCCLFGVVTGVALPMGGLTVLLGFFQRENRQPRRLWQNLGTLAMIVGLVYLLTLGPGNGFSLLNLRMRSLVALTGGEEKLQTWAMEVSARADESMDEHDSDWRVPRDEWSTQVRRLRPKNVNVCHDFSKNMNLVHLCYGGGFFHQYIVIGPPGFVHEAQADADRSDSLWIRWRDGMYCWFPN